MSNLALLYPTYGGAMPKRRERLACMHMCCHGPSGLCACTCVCLCRDEGSSSMHSTSSPRLWEGWRESKCPRGSSSGSSPSWSRQSAFGAGRYPAQAACGSNAFAPCTGSDCSESDARPASFSRLSVSWTIDSRFLALCRCAYGVCVVGNGCSDPTISAILKMSPRRIQQIYAARSGRAGSPSSAAAPPAPASDRSALKSRGGAGNSNSSGGSGRGGGNGPGLAYHDMSPAGPGRGGAYDALLGGGGVADADSSMDVAALSGGIGERLAHLYQPSSPATKPPQPTKGHSYSTPRRAPAPVSTSYDQMLEGLPDYAD